MTPVICDFTGKVIEPQFEPKKGPILDRDYYIAYNRILSLEAKAQLDEIVWETMKARGFGKYNFMEYKRIFKAAVEQYCNRQKTVYSKSYRVEHTNDYTSPTPAHW